MNVKCPHCERILTSIPYEPVVLGGPLQGQYKGVAYHCDSCKKVLGVEVDFLALKADLLSGVGDLLRRR